MMTDENLTTKHIRKLIRVILYVQRGLLHDADTFERHESLAQCAEALVFYSIKLRDSDAALVPLDGDIEFGMRIAEHEAKRWGEDNEAKAIFRQRITFSTYLGLALDPPEPLEVKQPANLDEFLANSNPISSDDLLPGDDILPDLTTMNDEPADLADDLYDGWTWDPETQGFINDGSFFGDSSKSDSHSDDDPRNDKDHKKKN